MGKIIDLSGIRIGRLTPLEIAGRDNTNRILWLCECACGNTVTAQAGNLKSGHTQSCGCLRNEMVAKVSVSHGMFGTPQYLAWSNARSRTTNPRSISWPNYGGRGITMCQEWKDSFEAFWKDMGPTWEEGLTLDRIDVDGNYHKENCRWVETSIQPHNQRKRKNCSSQYKGVFKNDSGLFIASISKNGAVKHLGSFKNETDAAVAYDNGSEELYGDRPNGTSSGSLSKGEGNGF